MEVPIIDHELLRAKEALDSKESLSLDVLPSGAALLFSKGFFPWKGLPYPLYHAKLGSYLMEIGQVERAEKMAKWQRELLDALGKPILSLFNQEGSCSYGDLEGATTSFLHSFAGEERERRFVDNDLGIVRIDEGDQTALHVASGCKSGMGAFLRGRGGVVNYGPQLSTVGDCSAFGLAGRPLFFRDEEEQIVYQTRLAASHHRNTGFPIEDSGYSGFWIEVEQSFSECRCTIAGTRAAENLLFSFFLKASCLMVNQSHRMVPRSLDRYAGPPSLVALECGITLEMPEGAKQMEIIPLAGDDSFWNADFLVTFRIEPSFRFLFHAT